MILLKLLKFTTFPYFRAHEEAIEKQKKENEEKQAQILEEYKKKKKAKKSLVKKDGLPKAASPKKKV
jgi:arginine utilization protein RocB